MKKKILIIVSVIFIIDILYFGFLAYKKYETKRKNSEKIYNMNGAEREKYVEEFSKKGQLSKESGDNNYNAGGYTGILIENRNDLMKYTDLEGLIAIDNKLKASIKVLSSLYTDISNIKTSEIEKYHNLNKYNIINAFGIEDFNEFEKLVDTLSFLDSSGSNSDKLITKAVIDSSSCSKTGNIILFNLKLTSASNKESIYKIKVLMTANQNKTDCIIYYLFDK